MLYPLLRNALFAMDAERTHDRVLPLLNSWPAARFCQWRYANLPPSPVTCCDLKFRNPVGLAAGLDKNGDYLKGLHQLGFGFCEIGTVTPVPQPGNPQPRLFRLPEDEALINRMGFNNKGVDHLVKNVTAFRQSTPQADTDIPFRIGINIGKNKDTPNEQAVDDYLICLHKVYEHADYITVNISSPNTPGLRELQLGDARLSLLQAIKQAQLDLHKQFDRYVPLFVKVAPDMSDEELNSFATDINNTAIDGVIATNTTNSESARATLKNKNKNEQGGISGKPVNPLSAHALEQLRSQLDAQVPIIGAGGIQSAEDAMQRLQAGASLIQVYTGLIYRGPDLIRDIVRASL